MKRWGPAVSAAFIAALISISAKAGSKSEAGLYDFQHFSAKDYAASPQNWAIAQDRRGVIYVGNTEGLLEFDGASWRLIKLQKPSAAVSVAIDNSGTVYVGSSEGHFGFLEPDAAGRMHFTSLLGKVPPEDRKFGFVWKILPTPEGIYFNAYDRLFRLNRDGTLKTWRPASKFGFAFYLRGELYTKTPEGGLQKLTRDVFSPVPGGTAFGDDPIMAADSTAGMTLFGTPKAIFRLTDEGIVPFKTEADDFFRANALRSLQILGDGQIMAGTKQGGIALLHPDGALERFVGRTDGLPGDYVSAIQADRQGGEWLAQVNGIARFNPAVTHFDDGQGLSSGSLVLSIARLGENVYVGTTVGLFRMTARQGTLPRFEKVEGAGGPVHLLLPIGDSLVVGRDAGLSVVKGLASTKISSEPAVVYDVSPSRASADVVFEAARDTVARLVRTNEGWKETARVSATGTDFHTVLEGPDGRVWATTLNEIWRIDFRNQPPAIERYGKASGVPGTWNNAYRFNGRVVFGTPAGLIKFDESKKRFVPDVSLGPQFADGSHPIFLIREDPSGDVWVSGKDYHGVLRRRSQGYSWEPMTFSAQGIREIYAILPEADRTVWVAGEGKLYRWDGGLAGDPNRNFSVLTRQVSTGGAKDSLFGGAGVLPDLRLPYKNNALRFEFAAPFYEEPGAVEYQTLLEGSDSDWMPWAKETRKDYTHLWEGHYTFHVRARNPHGVISEESVSRFGITPPWYRSWWAFILYAVAGALFVWAVVRLRVRQLQEDKRQLEQTVAERTVEIRQQRDEIHVQERRSQSLLLNILPAQVAEELKSTGAVKPEGFEDVTVCFTDFVGFTLSSEKMPPANLVDALNEYFTAFDEIIARYGLEKLKTIGDSYMFVSGLPERRASHAVDAVMAAIEMVQVVKDLAAKTDGTGWNIRVGLHSGPVVAGVVGIRKFAFDIWGNTVNFAARMESSGVPGSVNMSERTCRLTRGLIECEARGHVRIKEGRELPMFLARGVVPEFAPRYEAEFGALPRSMPSLGRVQVGAAAS